MTIALAQGCEPLTSMARGGLTHQGGVLPVWPMAERPVITLPILATDLGHHQCGGIPENDAFSYVMPYPSLSNQGPNRVKDCP